MHPRPRSIALVVAGGLFVAGFALAACGGDGGEATGTTQTETATETTTETATLPPVKVEKKVLLVQVVDGVPLGGIARATVKQGDRVGISVTSDVADEVHVHGYDLSQDVTPGGFVQIDFTATVPGRFEVELEQRGVQIADLTVEP